MAKKIFVLFLIYFNVLAQGNLTFNFDYAQFKYDSLNNYLEIYYSFNQNELKTTEQNSKNFVDAIIHLQIQNTKTNELVVNKDWLYKKEVNPSDSLSLNNYLLGVIGYVLKKGEYDLSITLQDNIDKQHKKEYKETIRIEPFNDENIAISDIELANKIVNESNDKNSIFYKNTLEVYPNPSMIFVKNSPVVFYYSELYNLNKTDNDTAFTLLKLIKNSKGKIINKSSQKVKSKKESIVNVGFVNMHKYPTGTYSITLSLKNNETGKAYSTNKKFFLINPDVKKEVNSVSTEQQYLSSEYGVLTMDECDRLFDQSKLIASKTEIEHYENLDSLSQKRKYLFEFWKARDLDKDTPQNEFKEIYFQRVKYANEHYKGFTMEGYKTDMGRVYILYGKPSEIERHPSSSNIKPYEIWKYNNMEGGVIFIFGDITGFNNYELLHSTKRGELQDPNWMRRIQG